MNKKIRKYNEGDHIILIDTEGVYRTYDIWKDHNNEYMLVVNHDLIVLQGN